MTFRAPDPAHPVYGRFWQPTSTAGTLWIPTCNAGDGVFWPPAEVCPRCLNGDIGWTEVPGTGTVWGTAEYLRAYSKALVDELPYQCVLVELDAGPRLVARYMGHGRAEPGQRVSVLRAEGDGYAIPYFVSAASPEASSAESSA